MKERPILFSGPMVRAILERRKTVTRRPIKDSWWRCLTPEDLTEGDCDPGEYCPYGKPGDRLWVRETWGAHAFFDLTDWFRGSLVDAEVEQFLAGWELDYRADWEHDYEEAFWRPSIHMPRWASRLTLEVTDVRVERLQDVTEEDAKAEGSGPAYILSSPTIFNPVTKTPMDYRGAFLSSFRKIYRLEHNENPWVWVVSFKRIEAAERAA